MEQFYERKIDEIQAVLVKLEKQRTLFAWARLANFIAVPVVFFVLANWSIPFAVFCATFTLFLLIYLIISDIKSNRKIARFELLVQINQQEISSLTGDNSTFYNGSEFADIKHPYSSDLDIFGESSLYQLFCRASTTEGRTRLAETFKNPQPIESIYGRQGAVSELSSDIESIQNFRVDGMLYTSSRSSLQDLFSWFSESSKWHENKLLRYSVNLLPYITITTAILWAFDILGGLFIIMVLVHLLIYIFFGKELNLLHLSVTKADNEMKVYSLLLSQIEKRDFKTNYLKNLQQQLKTDSQNPSQLIDRFARLVEKMDYRINVLFLMTIGFITFWDFRMAFKMIDWKQNYAHSVKQWIDVVGEFESLNSLATVKFNHPEWQFPVVTNNYFGLSAKELGHPLIKQQNRVCNNLEITDSETMLLLTGSNMAGKTTFLRTLGVNMVLAYAGASVCAKRLAVSYAPLLTSMRISDSLAENTSSFYAEIKRLGSIVESINAGAKPFLLLDEILRGTNSNDRHLGSEALIDLLIQGEVATIISTHDLQLASLSEKYEGRFINFHFDVQVNKNDELYFDYKIKNGVCQSLNASILMRKIGLNV